MRSLLILMHTFAFVWTPGRAPGLIGGVTAEGNLTEPDAPEQRLMELALPGTHSAVLYNG